jgi:two-component system sensor kinase FixL
MPMIDQNGTIQGRPAEAAGATQVRRAALPALRSTWTLSAGYIVLYVLLDRISSIEPLHGIDITPWNPQFGLALALLLLGGVAYAPLVVAAAFVSSQLVPAIPIPLAPALAGALVVGGGYTATAVLLRRVLNMDPRLHRSRDIVALVAVAVVAGAFVAIGFVATYANAGLFLWSDFIEGCIQLWIGNAIGVIVLAPLVLVTIDHLTGARGGRDKRRLTAALETAVQWGSIAGSLALMFGFSDHRAEVFYVLFLPLVWIAARRGLVGAVWAVLTVQVGLIAVLEFADGSVATIRTFQLLMFAVATTGLMLGAFVSERHRVARALAESRSHLAMIFNTAQDGVLMVDARGRIESVNPSVERMFGRPGRALVGRDIRDLIERPPAPIGPDAADAPAGGSTGPWELTAHRAGDVPFPIELSIGPFASSGQEHYTLVIRDITARRDAETRARVHQSELAHAARLTLAGEMASALAHELNQPLTAIAAYARGCLRVLRQSTPDVLEEGIQEVVHQAERAADVIARLREFVRTGSLHRTVVDVRDLLDGALALVRAEATESGIEIETRVPARITPVLVDRIHVEQVILNLVRNAMDAVALPSSATRRIILDARQTSAHTVEITVADSGPGIPADVAARLFHPFVTTKPGGMGLGLSISFSMIEAHGGQLRLIKNTTSGAAFAFELPVPAAQERADVG